MKNRLTVFYRGTYFHDVAGLILVHVDAQPIKRAGTQTGAKHRKMLVFRTGPHLILASIPWPFREEIARPLFRWNN